MLQFHEALARAQTPGERDGFQCQIGVTDRRIDQLVYERYGLTDDEIRIFEEATPGCVYQLSSRASKS